MSARGWRYAIGEIALIVIGVTLALAATSWYETRQDRRDELVVLRQLHQSLSEVLQELEETWAITRRREEHLRTLLAHLDSEQPYTPELGVSFQALLGWRIVRMKNAPFESLKEQGYGLISNAELRSKLISFYEDHYARLEYNLNLDRDFAIQKIQPYFFDNFTMEVAKSDDIDGGMQSWVPKNLDQIRKDGFIANVSRFRADLLRRFALRQYEESAEELHDILRMIEIETS